MSEKKKKNLHMPKTDVIRVWDTLAFDSSRTVLSTYETYVKTYGFVKKRSTE